MVKESLKFKYTAKTLRDALAAKLTGDGIVVEEHLTEPTTGELHLTAPRDILDKIIPKVLEEPPFGGHFTRG